MEEIKMASAQKNQESAKPNRAVGPSMSSFPDIDAAADMPNIDGRSSVLNELPKDLFLVDREFEIAADDPPDEIRFGKPRSQEIVHCHPDPTRKRIVWAIKDERNRRGNLFVVTQGMLKTYPRLKEHSKCYVLRQYVHR
jgi:hypothetical protein